MPEICLRGVHNEIHNIQKPHEALPSQVFLKVIQGQKAATGHILFLRIPVHNGHIKSPMGTAPLGTTAKFKLIWAVRFLAVTMPTSGKLRCTTFTVLNLA